MKILRNVTDSDPGSSTPAGAVGLGTPIAGGDLTGTHGVPIVGGIGGAVISGSPAAGEAVVATSSTTAAWTAVMTNPLTTKGDVVVAATGGTPARLGVGSDTQVLTADSASTNGVKWAAGGTSPLTTKGDLFGHSTVDARVPIGSNGQVLTADSTQTLGVKWAAGGGGSSSWPPLDQYAIDGTYGDHFTGGSLSGLWTRRTYTSGDETYQVGYNATYLRVYKVTHGAFGTGYFQTAPAGDWTFAIAYIPRMLVNNSMSFGIGVVNSVGTGLCVVNYTNPNNPIMISVTTYSTYGGAFVEAGVSGVSFFPQASWANDRKLWLYIRKSGTNYYTSYSVDGEVWAPESPAFSSAITVDRVGMFDGPLGTANSGYVDVDWFNKIA